MNSIVRNVLSTLFGEGQEPDDKVFQVGHAKSLSRAFASRLAMNGANDRTLGGWKTPRMLLRYSHLGPSHLQGAVEGLVKPKLQIVDDLPMRAVN